MTAELAEVNFDGLPGPAHNHAGLSPGNLASMQNRGAQSNPRQAALESIAKMQFVSSLGVPQAVLPPHERPLASALSSLGFRGELGSQLSEAAREGGHLLRLCSSSSAMWTANAATVAPSTDTLDGRLHLTVANLSAMFHRSLEARVTERVLSAIFADERHFAVHEALPPGAAFADEGAANHTRLCVAGEAVHLFCWGRSQFQPVEGPSVHPARQTLEASQAVARNNALPPGRALFWQQSPAGIDAGAFHSDVLLVGNEELLLFHELAVVQPDAFAAELRQRLGPGLTCRRVSERELPVADAVAAYPFNSQLVSLPDGQMALIAPEESRDNPRSRELLERLAEEPSRLKRICFSNVTGSMKNGGGPACLRLRVPMTEAERAAVSARVLVSEALLDSLSIWVKRHYRDRLAPEDLADPAFCREMRTALDELTQLLELGSVYDFQT